MVKRWRPIVVFALTFVLAVSVENEFFLFLLGFEAMVYAAAAIQAGMLAKNLSMRITLPERIAFRGETFQIRAELTNKSRMPVPQLMVRAAVRVFPEREELLMRGKVMLDGGETGAVCFELDSAHCACLEIRPNQLVVTDWLGLVQRRCRVNSEDQSMMFILPDCLKNGISLPDGDVLRMEDDGRDEKRGSTAIDVAEIRQYQQGDPIKLIHWKLSARLDALMVREMSDPADEVVQVYLNLREKDSKTSTRADKDAWDHFMQTVAGVSAILLEREKTHVVIWPDTRNDTMVSQTVSDAESQQMMLCELLRAETFFGKDYLPLFREVYSDEAKETFLEIDLQGRIDRSAP